MRPCWMISSIRGMVEAGWVERRLTRCGLADAKLKLYNTDAGGATFGQGLVPMRSRFPPLSKPAPARFVTSLSRDSPVIHLQWIRQNFV
jgi:hypothetical protein